jgi:hypothetical protein
VTISLEEGELTVRMIKASELGRQQLGRLLKDRSDALATLNPRISQHTSSNSKHRNGDRPLGTPPNSPGGCHFLLSTPKCRGAAAAELC